jgi:hypothetical protein
VFDDAGIAPIREARVPGREFDAQACLEECRRLARRIEAPLAPAAAEEARAVPDSHACRVQLSAVKPRMRFVVGPRQEMPG